MRDQLIANALKQRLDELCGERLRVMMPEGFGADAGFVSELREQWRLERPNLHKSGRQTAGTWMNSNTDCLSALQALSLGQVFRLEKFPHPLVDPFVQELDICRRDPSRRFQLLTERYACPLNFALPAEAKIREHVLTRLMVQDRASIEQRSVTSVDSDDLLLKLNLLAVHAQRASDLRFLDALNYYYELLPADWIPHARHKWLLTSYLGLYAGALAVRS